MMLIPFIKMHGIGNDFVIVDHRLQQYQFDAGKVADRSLGIGCDQVIIIEEGSNEELIDCKMRIYNANGCEVGACGNATRCVAYLMMEEKQKDNVTILVQNKRLPCWQVGKKMVKVNMGSPSLEWQDIPLSQPYDTISLPINMEGLSDPAAVNMGNPHVVFFVDDIDQVDLIRLGLQIENHSMFPEKVNVNIAQIFNEDKILLRVWERGVGETQACGSGACATLVAAVRKKHIPNHYSTISLPGGNLFIDWKDSGVFMTGSVEETFTGEFNSKVFTS